MAWWGRNRRDYSRAEFFWVTWPETLPGWFRSFSKPVEQALTADMTTLGTHTSRQSWKWGQENPSRTFSNLTSRNFLWLASVAAVLPSLRQDGGQGWNREEPRTQGGITASGPGRKTWRTGEKHRLESPEISAITGTPWSGRERALSAALPVPTACRERKAGGGCIGMAAAPIPQPALERHLVDPAPTHQGKGALPHLKSCLVSRWYRITAKQVTASLSGPEAWRDLESEVFLISCMKAWRLCEDALPCHSHHDDINYVNKEGGAGRLQPETILCRSGSNVDLHWCGKHAAPTEQ